MNHPGAAERRRVPERQCVACRKLAPRSGLLRLVRGPDGTVTLPEGRRVPGRSAYVCRDATCVGQAVRRGAFQRALKRKVEDDTLERLGRLVDQATPATQGGHPPTKTGDSGPPEPASNHPGTKETV